MEHAFLGLNILLLMLVWRFMIRKTVLDHTRDKLFDLRDEVRATFIANQWDLNSPVYQRLRDLLNGHRRFTEEYSIWHLGYLKVAIDRDKTLHAELHDKFEKTFSSNVQGQLDFVKSIRARSFLAISEFSVFGSGFLVFLTVLITPFVVVTKTVSVFNRGIDAATGVCAKTVKNFGRVSVAMLAAAAGIVGRRVVEADWFEPYSYKLGARS